MQEKEYTSKLYFVNLKEVDTINKVTNKKMEMIILNVTMKNVTTGILTLTNSMAYGTRRFNAAFTRALQ